MMKIRGIRKAFGKQHVLNGVDMDVDDGEVVVILGSSGSGKTTFLRCLNFLEKADAGHIDLDDSHIDVKSSSKKDVLDYQRKTAMVFQNYALFNNKTALENIAMPMIATGKADKAQADRRAEELIDKVGLSERKDFYPSQLSGGQQQRVACARAMMERPSVIFADEPTGNLDSRSSREVLGFLRQCVQDYGQSIVMVTHDPRAASFADRVLVLSDGSITQDMDHPTYDDILAVFAEHDDPDNGPVDVEPAAGEA